MNLNRSTAIPNILISLVLILLTSSTFSQYIVNPSLEGIWGDDFPPDGWFADNDWNDPNIEDVYTTHLGRIDYYPVDGERYCLLRARGRYYEAPYPDKYPYQREYLYQPLAKPLEANQCFTFSAWMVTNPDFHVEDAIDTNVAFPVKFQLWGANAPDTQETLLVETDPIADTNWKEYTFEFSTYNQSYSYIYITIMWDTVNVKPYAYNGFVLVDDLKLDRLGSSSVSLIDTVYFMGDNNTNLTAGDGVSYNWDSPGYLNSTSDQSVFLTRYTDSVSVMIYTGAECISEIFHIVLDCDTLYPGNHERTSEYYYQYEKDIVLEAMEGASYSWDPQINLSAYNVQAPQMLDYNENYTVEVLDRYGCDFLEHFHIIADCDSLIPGGSVQVLDTMVTHGSPIQLSPRYGTLTGEWDPDFWLEPGDPLYVTARPVFSTTYQARVEDQFGCQHNELFTINIELHIPNVITPNEDQYNDCMQVYGLPLGSKFLLYNKQGQLLYETYCAPDFCWDGKDNNGNDLKADNYWYVFEHPEFGTVAKGFVLLKR